MHARPVRQRGLNRAGETLLGRGVLLLPQGLDGPRNFRIIQEGCLLQEERVGSKRNEAERCAHEFKRDACRYRPASFDKRCAMRAACCAPCCSARILQKWIIDMSKLLPAKDAGPHGPARSDSPALLSRFGRAREAREERTEISLSHLI